MRIEVLKGSSPEAEAVMMVCIAAVAADGRVVDEEISRLRMLAYLSPLYRGVEDVDAYIRSMAARAAEEGEAGVLDHAAQALKPRLRETAYAWAADMVAADSKVLKEEHRFLSLLRGKLGIHGELAGKIKAVTAIRNRAA